MARDQGRPSSAESDCRVAVQIIFSGDQPCSVRAVVAAASRDGQAHVAVRIGRLLFYITDRAALASWQSAWRRAEELAERVFPEERDAIWQGKQADRRFFEATGNIEVKEDRDARAAGVNGRGSRTPRLSPPQRR